MTEKYLLILFYSASGAVKNLAHALADGAEEFGLEVKIRTVPKVSPTSKLLSLRFQKKVRFIALKKIF